MQFQYVSIIYADNNHNVTQTLFVIPFRSYLLEAKERIHRWDLWIKLEPTGRDEGKRQLKTACVTVQLEWISHSEHS